MPEDPTYPTQPRHPESLPPLLHKDGDREPPKEITVDPSPTPVVIGTPRGGGGEHP